MTESESILIACHEAGPSLDLEGAWQPGTRGGAVVAPPHPLYGGRLDNPVVLALAEGLVRAGLAVLRFNFRGTGRSQGAASDRSEQADADYRAALSHLAREQGGPHVAAGYSFGAATALRSAASRADIDRVLLVAPPLAMMELAALRRCAVPVHLFVGDDDTYAPLPELERTLTALPSVQLHVIAGADHFFSQGGLSELSALAQAAVT